MTNRCTKVRFPVFNGYEVRVILARNVKTTGRKLGTDLADCVAALVTREDKPKVSWIVLGPNARDAGSIAHEASHAIRALFACAGARMDEEAYAYHLDFLVGRIHKFLKRTA